MWWDDDKTDQAELDSKWGFSCETAGVTELFFHGFCKNRLSSVREDCGCMPGEESFLWRWKKLIERMRRGWIDGDGGVAKGASFVDGLIVLERLGFELP